MHFRVASHDIFRYVEEQRRCWLVRKDLDPYASAGGSVELRPGTTAQLLDRTLDDGTRTSRFTLIERKAAGAWTVRITTHARVGAAPWVLVDLIAPDTHVPDRAPRQRPHVGIPGFVRMLLDAIDGYDGVTRHTSAPAIVGSDDVGTVIDAICDPDRRGLVLVAGTPDAFEMDKWQAYVRDRLRDTVGLCTGYVLDHAATAELNRSLEGHGTPPGCFRTYLPDADPASTIDARRHRIMTTRTLTQRPAGYVRYVLAGAARAHVVDLPLPPDVAAVDRLVARWEAEALLDVPTPPQPVATIVGPDYQRVAAQAADLLPLLRDAVRGLLGDVDVDADSVALVVAAAERAGQLEQALDRARSALEDRDDEIEQLRGSLRRLRGELDDSELENALDGERMIELEDLVRHLRKDLMRRGAGDEAWAVVPEEERSRPPENVSELLDRLGELPHIDFTGDRDKALELDDLDPLGRAAKKAWRALLALDDYARLRVDGTFTGSVYEYCRETPGDGHGWSSERHAADESDATKNNPKFAAARMLPVPREVDPAGRVFMGAHFKLTAKGSVSPRLHYFDDAARSGLVYVGYLGRHLPNARTN